MSPVIAPQRLEAIWLRAGGKAKHLETKARVDHAWLHAVNLAFKNGGTKNIQPILDVLLEEFPHNEYPKAISYQIKFIKKK